jgi:HEAT repeat protein
MASRVLRRSCPGRVLGLVLAAGLATSCGTKPPYEGKSLAQLENMLKSPDPNTEVQGAYGLSLLGAEASPAVPTLSERLHSPHTLVRQNAAFALGKIGPPAQAAVPDLVRTLHDPEWTIRRQAALALGEIGPAARSAVADLKKLRGDLPVVRQAAADSLAKIASSTGEPQTP